MALRSIIDLLTFRWLRPRRPEVAVLRLAGVIGGFGPLRSGMSLASLESLIERAFSVPHLSAVALVINSPGGSPSQSALIANRVRDLAREKEVPVLAFCEDVAASGGYWLACAADEIFVQPTSIVGSIGVITSGFGFTEVMQKLGIERRVYTAGEHKSTLDPFSPENAEDVVRLKALQEDLHEVFKKTVRERRGHRLKAEEDVLFSGEFWSGGKAVELGLADSEGELRQVLRDRFGKRLRLRRIQAPKRLLRRLGLGRGQAEAGFAVWSDGLPGPADWAAGALAAVEERSLWSRFGL
ncbi:S49 family peptidase [Pelagibius litoralis]|uniref:S49 family peptidase n=1 Tax=Pelagibius litoralis TaxID=374515 RepID=A0A967EZA4_9PROT|nr:S49 family peptidase [Pelagibius litoralis]NIA70218.1 S49 family peptidase [Pelagibius litoralis]